MKKDALQKLDISELRDGGNVVLEEKKWKLSTFCNLDCEEKRMC